MGEGGQEGLSKESSLALHNPTNVFTAALLLAASFFSDCLKMSSTKMYRSKQMEERGFSFQKLYHVVSS